MSIRPAEPRDVPAIVAMIRELADYEKLLDACRADADALDRHLFGQRPFAEALVVDGDDGLDAFALYFHTYSTFECAPTLYLEDLYVRPHARRRGLGARLLAALAKRAVDRGCKRFEWAVLDWNEPAITFYRGLGAGPNEGWTTFRLDGDALEQLARRSH